VREYYKIYAWSECPFCVDAKDLLLKQGKQFMFCCIDDSPELLSYIKENYNWMTVPMIVRLKVTGPDTWSEEFVGGFSDLVRYFEEHKDG
tara:strand:+ start:539 stop:808 length:270 start_codon:yes stop_codon:yes gene_type:complete